MRIGVDLGGTKTEIIVLSNDGSEKLRRRLPTPKPSANAKASYAATLEVIRELVGSAKNDLGLPKNVPVGIGIPGTISAVTGLVKNSNSTYLNDKPFLKDIQLILGCDVRVENDANCFTLSEATDGAAAGASVVFGVIVGTGCGGGVVWDQKILIGANKIAGEWGHNPLPWPEDDERPGPPCSCRKLGCIESFISGTGLENDYAREIGFPGKTVKEIASSTDPVALSALARYWNRFARSIATVINVLDPEVVVVGGGVSNLTALYREVPKLWSQYIFSSDIQTKLVQAKHGDSSGVRGAAWLWPVG